MVTITHLVGKYVEIRPFLQEAFDLGIINYASLAERIQPIIEKELNQKVKHSALVMALRRVSENSKKKNCPNFSNTIELMLRSDISTITLKKRERTISSIQQSIEKLSNEKDNFSLINGDDYIEIISNKGISKKLAQLFDEECIEDKREDLAAVTIKYSRVLRNSPGVVAAITRRLSWNEINIHQIFSSTNEITIIIQEDKSTQAYNCLKNLKEERSEHII